MHSQRTLNILRGMQEMGLTRVEMTSAAPDHTETAGAVTPNYKTLITTGMCFIPGMLKHERQ